MLRLVALACLALVACKDKPKPAASPPAPRAAPPASPVLAEPAPSEDDLDRAPTATEIDRCARLYILAARCGWAYDHELGWYPATHTTRLGDNVARRACAVDRVATDDGPQMPMPRTSEAELAELAAATDCAGFRGVLAKLGPVHDQR